jgi:hypothetical protein
MKLAPNVVPHHSSCLAKNARSRLHVVADAQNVLMRKLGMVGDVHVESSDFDHYINTFKDGLTEAQVETIQELFVSHVLAPEEGDMVEEIA